MEMDAGVSPAPGERKRPVRPPPHRGGVGWRLGGDWAGFGWGVGGGVGGMKISWLVALVLVGPVCSWAGEKSAEELAGELLELVGTKEAMTSGFEVGMKPALDQMRKQGLPEAAITEISEEANAFAERAMPWAEIKPELVAFYADEFTVDDLEQLIVFYESPVGRKATEKLPVLMQKGMDLAMERMQTEMPAFQAKIVEIVGKHREPAETPE